jgi:hypothetical protein
MLVVDNNGNGHDSAEGISPLDLDNDKLNY